MAPTVEDLGLDVFQTTDGEAQEGKPFVLALPHMREKLHITIGTKGETKSVQAGEMVQRWRAYGRGGVIKEVKLQDMFTRGRVRGMQG